MALTQEEIRVLDLLYQDARITPERAAVMLGMTEQAVTEAIRHLEEERVIVGYPALINWDKTPIEKVKAVIVYLMSGAYDLMLEAQAATMRTLASFVSQKLATIDGVMSTATHFVLKKYKFEGVILEENHTDNRLAVSP